jgi:AraC-like DNA-binding protein
MFNSYSNNLLFDYVHGGITPVDVVDSDDYRVYPNWILIAPKNGSVNIEIRNDGIKYCHQGEAIVIKPNIQHRFFMVSQASFISRWSHVNFSLPGNIDVSDFLDTPVIARGTAGARIGDINEQLTAMPQNKYALQTESRFLELGFSLLQIICSISTERDFSALLSDRSHQIRNLLEYIDKNLDKELTRDILADYCGFSTARFHVVFQKFTGMAPMTFVKHQRMKKAKLLLARTDIPISQISGMTGYYDPYTFSRAFKNTVGISPKPYRIKIRRDTFFNNS